MKKVGKIKDAHSLKGEMYVLIFSKDISWIKKMKTCEVHSDSFQKCFLVERAKPYKEGLLLKVQDVQDRTEAEKYKGCDFFIEDDLLVSKKGETIFLSEILDFQIIDIDGKMIGKIQGFSSNGPQDLLLVETSQRKEVMIPFVDAFIRKIDFENQKIIMELPEGMLEIND